MAIVVVFAILFSCILLILCLLSFIQTFLSCVYLRLELVCLLLQARYLSLDGCHLGIQIRNVLNDLVLLFLQRIQNVLGILLVFTGIILLTLSLFLLIFPFTLTLFFIIYYSLLSPSNN